MRPTRFFAALAAFTMVLISGLAVSSPASAVQACPNDWICWYDNAQVGTRYNEASYVINKTNSTWRIYDANNCTGVYGTLYANSSGGTPTFNNKGSSYKRINN